MGNENEPAKLLLPYLQRADELQAHDPLVAYYCRLYAMERGLKIPQTERTKTTNSLLVSLMKQLEKDKKSLQLGPDDSLHLEGFALNVFAKADKQDRAGRADKSTAKTFYAASIFFEILNQFGQLQPDIEQKQKYAAWKAADISKALKEGKKPVPGPPGADNDLSSPSSSGYNNMDPGMKPASEFDPSSRSYDQVDPHKSSDTAPFPSEITKSSALDIPPSAYPAKKFPSQSFHQPPSTDDYPSHNYHQAPLNDDYPSHNSHQPPSLTSRSENNIYAHPQEHHQQPFPQEHHLQPFPQEHHQLPFPQEHHQQPFPQEHHQQSFPQEHHQQSFPQEPPQHLPQYQSHDTSSFSSYPNFQTYPSFTESSLPAAPSHPPYYQGSSTSYVTSASDASNYPSTAHQSSNGRIGTISDIEPTPVQEYKYSNYQPPPEKISEAHKAARFAVGALAFDDVSIAVDYLKKSLELLTNPSAGQ